MLIGPWQQGQVSLSEKPMQELLNLILSFFSPKPQATQPNPGPSKVEPKEATTKDTKVEINWSDPKAKISKYFTVHEALYLPSWNCHHLPTEEEKANILKMAAKMDTVREFLGKPISVHCWLRPGALNCSISPHNGEDYNAFVKGAKRSAHKVALGVDFDCGENCDETRKKLEPKLQEFDMCMEIMPGGNWVHLDIYEPAIHGGVRYFKP